MARRNPCSMTVEGHRSSSIVGSTVIAPYASIAAMPASTRKQLNIRSDEAYAAAHHLAEQLGITTTEAVVRALREFHAKRRIPSQLVTPEEADANLSALMKSVLGHKVNNTDQYASNHDDFYDEFGFPK